MNAAKSSRKSETDKYLQMSERRVESEVTGSPTLLTMHATLLPLSLLGGGGGQRELKVIFVLFI
jgi:hypothetical protein